MIEQNRQKFDFLNILNWHEKGYSGKGMCIGSTNECQDDLSFYDGKLINFFNLKKPLNAHGQKVLDLLHQVVPQADIHMLPYGINSNGTGDIFKGFDYCLENNIKIVQNSSGGIFNKVLDNKYRDYHNKGLYLITSAGNVHEEIDDFGLSTAWITVGGLDCFTYSSEQPIEFNNLSIQEKSSFGKDLDYMNFFRYYIHDGKRVGKVFSQEGTSFASPVFAGMCLMVLQYYKDNYNIELTNEELDTFILEHSYSLSGVKNNIKQSNFDETIGNGIFILPNLDKIENKDEYFKKYIKQEVNTGGDENMFTDVKDTDWFAKDVNDIAMKGIITGYPNGTFKPSNKVTRAELAVILNRTIAFVNKKTKEVSEENQRMRKALEDKGIDV